MSVSGTHMLALQVQLTGVTFVTQPSVEPGVKPGTNMRQWDKPI